MPVGEFFTWWHTFRRPRIKPTCANAQVRRLAFFSFGPGAARFLFGKIEKKMGGALPPATWHSPGDHRSSLRPARTGASARPSPWPIPPSPPKESPSLLSLPPHRGSTRTCSNSSIYISICISIGVKILQNLAPFARQRASRQSPRSLRTGGFPGFSCCSLPQHSPAGRRPPPPKPAGRSTSGCSGAAPHSAPGCRRRRRPAAGPAGYPAA